MNDNEKVKVGDLIWIIDAERHSVVPARVNEQIVSKTITGEKTYHHIEFPSGKKQKLENLTAPWYSKIDGVREHLLQRAKDAIEGTVNSAKNIAQEKFEIFLNEGSNEEVDLGAETSEYSNNPPDGSVRVSLDDGKIVNVRVPQGFLDESSGN